MRNIAIIPARMGSTRYPGKPLADIRGTPMLGHVYYRTKMCQDLSEVYIATCDEEIMQYAESIGAKAIMTSDTHERCSDRTAEAMLKIEEQEKIKTDIVVMIQGDEPMLNPETIDLALKPLLEDPQVNISNIMMETENVADFEDPSNVKTVVDLNGNALYFSREPVPSMKKGVTKVSMYFQLGIILFRRDHLLKFNDLPQTPLEIIESVDMLRFVENGEKVRMVLTPYKTINVDTIEDLQRVDKLMQTDELMKEYA